MSSLDDPVNSMETCSQVASRRPESTSFATLPRIAHVLFFNSAAIQFTVSYHCEAFPCVAPCREYIISTWQFYEVDQVIPRFIGEWSTKIKMIMHDAHDLFITRYLCTHCRFDLCTFYFVFHSFFFFFYSFFKLKFLYVEKYNSWNIFFRVIIWLLISVWLHFVLWLT